MTADAGVYRAMVEAGAAADALQRLPQLGVGQNFRAAVVQNDEVHFSGAVFFFIFAGRGNQIDIGGNQLPGGRADQQAQQRDDVFLFFHHLFQTHHGDVHRWNRGAHAAVAFVFHEAKCPGLRNGKINAAQADLGFKKFLAQGPAGDGV
jgi:hypothetical protein